MTSEFKYLWEAKFKDKTIRQPEDDKYSKHDPTKESNPSSFRDFLDYFEDHKNELEWFMLYSPKQCLVVDFPDDGKPKIYGIDADDIDKDTKTILVEEQEKLTDLRVIYFRQCSCKVVDGVVEEKNIDAYVIGYQGLNAYGKNVQTQITVV